MRPLYDKWKQYQYYVIISVISLVALFFLPMLGSSAGLAWALPSTFAGWVVYITSKLLVAILNILIFHCFILQGKVNIQDNEKYLEALRILAIYGIAEAARPRSPEEYHSAIYGKKGATIFITSLLSAIGLTQAVLTFDLISMLTYFFTVLMGVIFGILQMNQVEIYWTEEFYSYAKYIEKTRREEVDEAMAVAAAEIHQQTNDITSDTRGSDILVSADNPGASGYYGEP